MKNDTKNSIVEILVTEKIEKAIKKVLKLYDKYLPKDGKFDNYIISNIGYRLPIANGCYIEMSNDITDIMVNNIILYVENIPYIKYRYKGIANTISNLGNGIIAGATLGIAGKAQAHIITKVPEMLTSRYLKNVAAGIKNALPNIEKHLKASSKNIAVFYAEIKNKGIKYTFSDYKKSDDIKAKCQQNRVKLGIEIYSGLHNDI